MVHEEKIIAVSVCIPAYNNVASLKRCLESVFMQQDVNYEIVVTDDSDNDAVGKLVLSYLSPVLRYHRNQPGLGSPANWNKAISLAAGRYIKVMHHDDYFSRSDSLAKFVLALDERPGAALAFSYASVFFKTKNMYHLNRPTRTQLSRLRQGAGFLLFRNVIGNPSSVILRSRKDLAFDENYRWLVDVELYIRLLKVHPEVVCIHEALVTSVDGESGQITQHVAGDAAVVVGENLSLFSTLFTPGRNNRSASLYFQELFSRFGLTDLHTLESRFTVPPVLRSFLKDVFRDLPKNRLWKRFIRRLLTSRYNKRLFRIERF